MKPYCISLPNLNCALLLNVNWFQISKSDQSSRGLNLEPGLTSKLGTINSRRWSLNLLRLLSLSMPSFNKFIALVGVKGWPRNFLSPILKSRNFWSYIMAHHFAHCIILQSKKVQRNKFQKNWLKLKIKCFKGKQFWISNDQIFYKTKTKFE